MYIFIKKLIIKKRKKLNVGLELFCNRAYQKQYFTVIEFYKLKIIIGKPSFWNQFKKVIKHYKRVGYNMDDINATWKNRITSK